MADKHNSGFTLIELSIVLVIIGLIVGGVLVGQDLIHAAKLQATIKQSQQLDAAVNAFKIKFNCLPGDCADATGLGFSPPSIPPQTPWLLNGDGDEKISYTEGTIALYLLASAGLLANVTVDTRFNTALWYASLQSGGTSGHMASWIPLYLTDVGITVDGWSTVHGSGHYLWLADQLQGGVGAITPLDAMAIDQKLDDGLPASGTVIGYQFNNSYNFDGNGYGGGLMPYFNPGGGTGAAGGAHSDTCIADDVPIQYYNAQNTGNWCMIAVRMSF